MWRYAAQNLQKHDIPKMFHQSTHSPIRPATCIFHRNMSDNLKSSSKKQLKDKQ